MFGEKILAGPYEFNVDSKGRAFVPASTEREEGDILALTYDEDINSYRLYNTKDLEETFDLFQKLILESKSKEEEIQCKKKALVFYKSIVQKCVVDAQGRVAFGTQFEKGAKIEAIGAGNHLILNAKSK